MANGRDPTSKTMSIVLMFVFGCLLFCAKLLLFLVIWVFKCWTSTDPMHVILLRQLIRNSYLVSLDAVARELVLFVVEPFDIMFGYLKRQIWLLKRGHYLKHFYSLHLYHHLTISNVLFVSATCCYFKSWLHALCVCVFSRSHSLSSPLIYDRRSNKIFYGIYLSEQIFRDQNDI